MPPATKRRKISATTTRSLTAPATQRGIQAFGKISKSQVQDPRKGVLGKNGTATHSKDAPSCKNSKKRKLGATPTPTDNEEGEKAPSLSEQAQPIDDGSGRAVERSADSPRSTSTQTSITQEKTPLPSDNVETPTKGARSWIESLALASSLPSNPSSLSRTTHSETPPSSLASAESESHPFPDELQDIVNLYSSFLTALSLHYAHNGSMTPADLRNLGPSIERAWRKRRVTPQDVRRILAIGRPEEANGHERAGPLYLSDYGHGKICVEITDHPYSRTTTRRPINEEVLNTVFLRNLEQHWMCYKTDEPADPSPSKFLASLALLPITPCTSLSKIVPLLSKGQRRLEDLKAGAIKAQKPLSLISANPTTLPVAKTRQTSARSTDLFLRLKAKQLHQSTLPLPPPTEVLARKSALQHLYEITPVLESLAFSSKKHANDDAATIGVSSMAYPVSFTMPTLVQHLQMSLRNPIGKEEVIKSVRMLAEVAPEWVGLKEVGRMLGVTIKGAGLRKDEIGRRVGSLLEKL
ncbi:MAG: hypothetical protein Q9175_002174 [Cornicularia normoerica]